jgi:DNA-binding transcriptional LysR family regulator
MTNIDRSDTLVGVVDLAALETFVAVAHAGSVARAAERLRRTQPAISARLAAIEGAWSTRLFRRHARGMTLTPEGSRLLPLAEAALRGVAELDAAAGVPVAGHDELRIGAGDALGREVVPRAISRLLRERPRLSVRMLEGPAPRLREALRAGEIDLALTVAGAAADDVGISVEPLVDSPVDLLAPTSERLSGEVALPRLAGRRMVTLQRGSAFRRHVEAAFAAGGVPFQPAVEVGNLSLVRRFVAAGLGVAPVPAIAFSRRGEGLAVRRHRLRGIPPVRYQLARRSGVSLSSPSERFISLLRG